MYGLAPARHSWEASVLADLHLRCESLINYRRHSPVCLPASSTQHAVREEENKSRPLVRRCTRRQVFWQMSTFVTGGGEKLFYLFILWFIYACVVLELWCRDAAETLCGVACVYLADLRVDTRKNERRAGP